MAAGETAQWDSSHYRGPIITLVDDDIVSNVNVLFLGTTSTRQHLVAKLLTSHKCVNTGEHANLVLLAETLFRRIQNNVLRLHTVCLSGWIKKTPATCQNCPDSNPTLD